MTKKKQEQNGNLIATFFAILVLGFAAINSGSVEWNSPIGSIEFTQDSLRVPVTGKDSAGNRARFEFYTLIGVNHDYGWVYARTDQIYDSNTKQTFNAESFLKNKFANSGISERIRGASDVIAVGVSSCEGNQQNEERRAETRAKVIRRSLEPVVVTTQGDLYLLLLGQYKDTDCSSKTPIQTLPQRSIIIIGVIDKDQNINLEEAVQNAALQISESKALKHELEKHLLDSNKSSLGGVTELGDYSLFDLKL